MESNLRYEVISIKTPFYWGEVIKIILIYANIFERIAYTMGFYFVDWIWYIVCTLKFSLTNFHQILLLN